MTNTVSKPLQSCMDEIRSDLSRCETEITDLRVTFGKCQEAFNLMSSDAELPFLNRARETLAVLLDTTVQRMYGNHIW